MKYFLGILSLASAILLAVTAMAAPVPASYDDAAWGNYIEKGNIGTVPKGVPTGPGAISSYHGKGFWPKGYVTITSPYNMSKASNLVFSYAALRSDKVYASETMKRFLDATAEKAIQLSHNSNYKLPVYMLAENESVVPYSRKKADVLFGIALIADGKPLEEASGFWNGKKYNVTLNGGINDLKRFNALQKSFEPLKSSLQSMTSTDFENNIRSVRSKNASSGTTGFGGKNEAFWEYRVALVQNKNQKTLKQLKEEDSDLLRIQSEIDSLNDELDSLKDMRKTSMDMEERRELNEQSRELMARKTELMKEKSERLKEINQDGKAEREEMRAVLDAKRKVYEAEVQARKDERAQRDADAGIDPERGKEFSKKEFSLDVESTWILIEAVLTQDAAVVSQISMPVGLMGELIVYAKNANKSAKVMKLFDEKVKKGGNRIRIKLVCSARDRFLGCHDTGIMKKNKDEVDEIEDIVSRASTSLLKAAEELPDNRKLEILQLVANAAPKKVDFLFDTTSLRQMYVTADNPALSLDYLTLFESIEKIRIDGEKGRSKRLKNLPKVPDAVLDFKKTSHKFATDNSVEAQDGMDPATAMEMQKAQAAKDSSAKDVKTKDSKDKKSKAKDSKDKKSKAKDSKAKETADKKSDN